jgi:glycosyltransferase involved in cell wall biosynthesis
LGRLSVEKGVFDLVRAWEIVIEKFPEATLLVVGSTLSGADRLAQEIRKKHLEQKITLHIPNSYVGLEPEDTRREKVISLLKMSRLVVFLSRIEGWGLVPLEGFACGLPVIAYDLPIYKENIKNCEAAFLVPVGDFLKAAERIINVLSMREQDMYELGERAKKFASQYDWDKLVELAIDAITF